MTMAANPTLELSPGTARLDDEAPYEIIDGQRVELPPMSILANRVASLLHIQLGQFVVGNRLGEALVDTLIHLPLPADRNRRPDLAFVSAQRIAQCRGSWAPTMPGTSFPS